MQGEKGEQQRIDVEVFKSQKKADTYLYLPVGAEFGELPELLQEQFLDTEPFLSFELTADRYLAQADPLKVITSIQTQGFYLQFPPPPEIVDGD